MNAIDKITILETTYTSFEPIPVYTMDLNSSPQEKELLSKLLGSVGLSFEVPENQINAYCGLFSSGVGFMFPILEGLSDGAVKMGIPRDLSLQIAAQTMKGSSMEIRHQHYCKKTR